MTNEAPTPPDSTDIVFGAVRLLCNERGIDIARCESGKPGVLAAKLKGSTREWELLVDCQEERMSLPAVGLRPPRGLLPHVSYHGGVCVDDGQGLSIDPDRREDIAVTHVARSLRPLRKWSLDEFAAHTEFMKELEGYWNGLPGAVRGQSVFEVDSTDRLVSAYEEVGASNQPGTSPSEGRAPGVQPREACSRCGRCTCTSTGYRASLPIPTSSRTTSKTEFGRCCRLRNSSSGTNSLPVEERTQGKRAAGVGSAAAGGRSLVGAAFAAHKVKLTAASHY